MFSLFNPCYCACLSAERVASFGSLFRINDATLSLAMKNDKSPGFTVFHPHMADVQEGFVC